MPDNHPSFRKQIFGAVVGGSLAMALYAAYQIVSPNLSNLTGVLILPQEKAGVEVTGDVRIANNNLDNRKIERIAAKAQRIATNFSSTKIAQEPVERAVEIVPIALPSEQEILDAWGSMEGGEQAQTPAPTEPTWDENTVEFSDEPAFYGETDTLPDSGIGLWFATLIAIAGATLYWCKCKFGPCTKKA